MKEVATMDNMQQQPDLEARSPWSTHAGIDNVRLQPSMRAVDGTLQITGSKSLTNRALILAALAAGTSRIEGILRSDDAYWCIDCLKKLGIRITVDGDCAEVEGCGGNWPNPSADLYAGAAGTVARFLPGALAAGKGSWTMSGSKRMQERPLAPLLEALVQLGARFEYAGAPRSLPFRLEASGLAGGEVALPGDSSSQFISGLLLAAPYAREAITIRIEGEVVQRDYVEMTLRLMQAFGIAPQVSEDGQSITVPVGRYQARTVKLEPDVSTCCYFWALAALTAGRVRIEGIDAARTTQPDIEMLDLLERMGCTIIRGHDYVEVQGAEELRGGFTVNMKRWSDQTLTVAVLAIFADGPITMTDAAHIRHHECDRIAAICEELRRMGITADEHPDGLTVYPGEPKPALLDSHDDHRMAMALALIGSRVNGIRIMDPGCVSKTCPDYFDRMADLGLQIEYGAGGSANGR
jgi:3-phosphoshikimate 1-carboxyvinyltransferase